jgi:hypothetical protein
MKYLCLIYQDESVTQTLPKAEAEKIHGEYLAFTDEIKKSSRFLGNNGLQPTQTATRSGYETERSRPPMARLRRPSRPSKSPRG